MAETKSLLVYVNGDTFGDALIKLPAIQALRSAFPGYHISWLAGRGGSLFCHSLAPTVDGALDDIVEHAGIGEHWHELLRRPLAGRRFDVIIDTQQFLKTSLILRRIPHGLFISGSAGFRLSDRRPPAGQGRATGMQARLMQLISLAAGHTVAPVYGVRLPAALPKLARHLLPDGPVYVGLAPGAGQAWKCWPLPRFIDIAQRQAAKDRVPVFFIGPDERAWVDELAAAVPTARFPEMEELGDQQPGPLLAIALAQRLAVALANDSGTGHMLAAGGIPLVSLFGSTDPRKFAPSCRRLKVLQAGEFGGRDMDTIPVDAVDAALDSLLVTAA